MPRGTATDRLRSSEVTALSNKVNAASAGTLFIGGDIEVTRLGFGTLEMTGAGAWGITDDAAEAVRTLEALPELGVNFVDTAASYGPDISEELIREALHPYKGMLIATKGGLVHPSRDVWRADATPDHLKREVIKSCEKLEIERIDLWQLHRIDPNVPRDVQFATIASLIAEKLVRHVGLSEAGIKDIEAAEGHFPVATVQNRYNLFDRSSQDVLYYCEAHGIGFIPWAPLASRELRHACSDLRHIARAHGATESQIALAWLLKRSPVMLPIPGTSKVAHLEENVAAAGIRLTDDEFAVLDQIGSDGRR